MRKADVKNGGAIQRLEVLETSRQWLKRRVVVRPLLLCPVQHREQSDELGFGNKVFVARARDD